VSDLIEPLDPILFRTWLEVYPYHTVGLAGDVWRCPLACWLSLVRGKPYEVGGESYGVVGVVESERLPAWAKRFVRLVDGAYGCRPVLRIGALSLLDRCLREVT
jgi:hypothetical protein